MIDLVETLSGKWEDGTRPADLYKNHVAPEPNAYVTQIVDGLRTAPRKPQSGCAELASLLSEEHTELLWPERALFVANIGAKAPVLRWEAVCTLGNLSAVDRRGELRATIPEIEALLDHDSIVLKGHAVHALTKMARAYPEEAAGILDQIIAAAPHFQGSRVGFLVEAMAAFADDLELRPKARAFAETFLDSDVKSVASKARRAVRALPG